MVLVESSAIVRSPSRYGPGLAGGYIQTKCHDADQPTGGFKLVIDRGLDNSNNRLVFCTMNVYGF